MIYVQDVFQLAYHLKEEFFLIYMQITKIICSNWV